MAGGGNLFLYGAGSNPFLDAAALLLDISALLYLMVLWAAPLWASKRRALAYDFLVALLVTVLITEVLKFVIGARRPAEDYPGLVVLRPALFPDLSDPSFPSGHTSRAFVFAAVLGLHERKWLPVLLPYAALVGLARVYEGAHYPVDVLGGAAVGLAIGVLFWSFNTWPPYVRIRERIIGRWLSPGPGGRGGSTSPSAPGPR